MEPSNAELLLADDDLFLLHQASGYHPERPERLLAARAGVKQSLLASRTVAVNFGAARVEQITRVHGPDYLDSLARLRGSRGHLDGDTYYSEHTFDASVRAAGAGVGLVEQLVSGQRVSGQKGGANQYGLALVRPPGHHARPSNAMGFCLVNTAAVAAVHALDSGVERVLILDWDVHHGNGTEEIFCDDPRVLYLSLHQSPLYPGTGPARYVGEGKGCGFTVNVPLGAGARDEVYAAAFERIVIPIVKDFEPGFVIVSAGYDAHVADPVGGMALTSNAYAHMTASLLAALPDHGSGRTLFLLEGGYDLPALSDSVRATLDAIVESPNAGAAQPLPPSFERQLDAAIAAQRSYWSGLR